ncbi:MAG TPA: formate dehydrogenase subunit gamma [Candidatus Acidoferrum sp.]|nr:formate dehydrogenase subunit gamma [Candidatus Acidoferrum sp.]
MSGADQVLPSGRILRYPFNERATHWCAAASYIYLLLTGLAFWSPWCFWLAIALGGGQVSRALHPWAGLIFVIAVLFMYGYWAKEMRSTAADKAWWDSIGHYIRNEDEQMPPAGRYNPGQKLLFWGFVFCAILLLLSGLAMWFTTSIPWNLRFLRYAAVLVHVCSALLTIGLFLIHIYMSVFAERGAFGSVVRGDVSAAFAKRYHPAWYEEITGRTALPKK